MPSPTTTSALSGTRSPGPALAAPATSSGTGSPGSAVTRLIAHGGRGGPVPHPPGRVDSKTITWPRRTAEVLRTSTRSPGRKVGAMLTPLTWTTTSLRRATTAGTTTSTATAASANHTPSP
ncbi:hypothetical protein WBK31_39420 [Nonomuraea sp. N2-4H]